MLDLFLVLISISVRSFVGKSFSPMLRRELANLDKDADSRRTAMKALKTYVKELDSKAIPVFLAQVSENKETGALTGECTISLYEVLARVHGVNIVPQIDRIMTSIIKTLASSAGSFPLQQACSKVVPAIARYGIDPTTPDDKKTYVIHSLCNPLSESLLGSQESLTAGAALCLKALVDSDNWRFASDEMVNKVCQNVAGALEEKFTQTNSHMGLVMTLAKRNPRIVEPYARLLLQAGLRILKSGMVEKNSQKRLSSIQMINFLMKCLDPWSIFSELQTITEEMENCQSDQMAYVKGAAFETLQTARRIAADEGSKMGKSPSSVTGSNFIDRRRSPWRNGGSRTPSSESPESQTHDSFFDYGSLDGSPFSSKQASLNSGFDRRSMNRKLWRYENGGVDISLKDGLSLFSDIARGTDVSDTLSLHSESHKFDHHGEEYADDFAGFFQMSPPRHRLSRSTTTSPVRSRNCINVEDMIFKTPRKLVHSLQDLNDANSDYASKSCKWRQRSLSLGNLEWSPRSCHNQNGSPDDQKLSKDDSSSDNDNNNDNDNDNDNDEQSPGGSESVSSTGGVPVQAMPVVVAQHSKIKTQYSGIEMAYKKTALKLVCGFSFLLFTIFTSLLWINEQDQGTYLVPT
ncbi:protein SINE1-like isoform X1 [Cucurbita pepo subsp. pepo]|uniref:protein SINE1-like isoform X1 n=1 Tax=Cucurbita pepo subsp. pepo TaxID=3664 RepID=UPI000C9DA246|nr:protein SINE1-like isoform X1 [Cucurbita pepo subsp. pepo]XP_023522699.1 protein SINE1-like isoform X1 [Cucurbita pepo subsp. pepo]